MSGAVHWLHGGVREEGKLIARLDFGGGTRHGASYIADVLRNSARTERGAFKLVHDVPGGKLGMRTVVPFDDQGSQALLRRPHMIGYDGDGIVEPHDLAHTLDRPGRRIIHAFHATAKDGGLRERCDLHSGRSSV